jgi:acyl carrier protein
MQDQITDRILKVIAKTQKLPEGKVTLDSSFEELSIDSMDGVNILFALENEFDITVPDEDAKKIRSIRDIVDGVTRLVESKGAA